MDSPGLIMTAGPLLIMTAVASTATTSRSARVTNPTGSTTGSTCGSTTHTNVPNANGLLVDGRPTISFWSHPVRYDVVSE